ncbi:MAG: hypothetical protein J6B15_00575 [Muribaculaceae bacterium]|nr:hypothetical protein [Muribaculaceae bacterium]
MKKFYSIFVMAIMAIVAFNAKADITVTLKVDDATRLTANYQYYGADYTAKEVSLDLTQFTGEGATFTVPASYCYVNIYATDGNTITSAMNETTGSSASIGSSTYFYIYADAVLSVTSADLEATRTASCTVNVDDASKVNMSYYSGTKIELVNGANTIKFNPNNETPFQISHASYGEILYQVALNNVVQTDSYGRYVVSVADGDVLDIKADFPDEPTTITFSYGDNEAEVLGCLSVKVDGEAVEDFDGKTLTAKLGQKITIVGDVNLYNFNYSIYVDGASVYFSGNYEFTATKTEYAISIDATKYTTFNVYATTATPEYISVYAGTSSDVITLSTDTTAIALTSNNNYINIMPATDCFITSVLVNGVEYGSNYGTSSVSVINGLAENDTIVITADKLVREKEAYIWVDDLTAAMYGYSVQRYSDRASINLISGEAVTVNFADTDNPYYLSFFQPTYCSIFVNGVYLVPQYEGSTSYYVTLVDGDDIKVYLASQPEKYAVTITQNVEDAISAVATDGQAYSNYASGFTALDGTVVSITLADTKASVTVDGATVEADADGKYNVVITKETNIVVDKTNAIEEVVEVETLNNNVYNLQGILVVKNATESQINALPAGLYIINGKKVAVK